MLSQNEWMSRSIDHLAVSVIWSMGSGAIVGSGCLNGSHLINIAISRSHVCYWCAIHRKIAFLDARHGACSSSVSDSMACSNGCPWGKTGPDSKLSVGLSFNASPSLSMNLLTKRWILTPAWGWTAAAQRAARWPSMPVLSPSGSSSESDPVPGNPLRFVLRFNAGRELKMYKFSMCTKEQKKPTW